MKLRKVSHLERHEEKCGQRHSVVKGTVHSPWHASVSNECRMNPCLWYNFKSRNSERKDTCLKAASGVACAGITWLGLTEGSDGTTGGLVKMVCTVILSSPNALQFTYQHWNAESKSVANDKATYFASHTRDFKLRRGLMYDWRLYKMMSCFIIWGCLTDCFLEKSESTAHSIWLIPFFLITEKKGFIPLSSRFSITKKKMGNLCTCLTKESDKKVSPDAGALHAKKSNAFLVLDILFDGYLNDVKYSFFCDCFWISCVCFGWSWIWQGHCLQPFGQWLWVIDLFPTSTYR